MANESPMEALANSLFLNGQECILRNFAPQTQSALIEEDLHEQDRYINSMAELTSAIHHRFQCDLAERRRLRNSMLGVHRLPNEVLATLFIMAMEYERPQRFCCQRGKLELVCDSWRTIIHTSPIFWARVSSAFPDRVNDQSLRLSKEHPLKCATDPKTTLEQDTQFWERIEPYSYRYSSIDATASGAILNIVNRGLPKLKGLKLGGDSPESNDVILPITETPWPQLQYLELIRISLPWTCPMVSNLVWLILDDVPNLPLEIIIEILRRSPQLTCLDIGARSTLMSLPGSASPPPNDVPLPLLRELHLYRLSGGVVNHILGLIQPILIQSFTLTLGSPPSDPELSDLPVWSVTSAVDMLSRSNQIYLAGGIGDSIHCWSESYRFDVRASTKVIMPWLAGILTRYPDSSPPILILCRNNLDMELLASYLGNLVQRCELTLETRDSESQVLSNLQYLCRCGLDGSFPLAPLKELSIFIRDEEMANSVAKLLTDRYQGHREVLPLRKLSYRTGFGGYPFENFEHRMKEILGSCSIEWEVDYEWSGMEGSENGDQEDFDDELASPGL